LEAEYKTIFADQVLAFVDRLSMAHSLEVRSAFLDTKLVEFVAQLPGNLKIKNGQTKYLLKKAALKYFPEQMVNRKKEGFLMPITEWLSGELEPYVRDVLSKERLAKHQLFDADAVTNLVNKLYLDKCDYTHVNKVFALVVFQEWYELYMGSTANCQAQVEPAQL
jgi:asparagine synthase (glutamine-hydrolysing)